jgi:uncharacterized membrane protein YgdD (TMEM256/DUF423 family)
MFSQRSTLLAGAIFGGLGVALGAFGAHVLKPMLLATNHLDTYELAVRYQFYHAFALLFIGLLMGGNTPNSKFKSAALFMILGTILFCGSLYALAFDSARSIAFITPIGGVFFMLGWIWLGMEVWKRAAP